MRRQQGISWLEFAVTAVLISVLALLTLGALWRAQGQAEATLVDLTLRNMATALRLRQLDLLLRGDAAGMAALAGANPVAWLDGPPANYRGEVDGTPVQGPAWYFDRRRGELVYRPGVASYPLPDGAEELRWRVERAGGSTAMPGARINPVAAKRNGVK
jgi:general secretion pathway protein G